MNTVSSVSADMQRPKKREPKKNIEAILLSTIPKIATIPLQVPILKSTYKIQKELSKDEIDIVNAAVSDTLYKKTNLGKKGVILENFNEVPPNLSKFPDKIHELFHVGTQIAKGENAGFINKEGAARNTILVNRNKAPMLTFHELGHAFDFNNSTFWKTVQKMRTSPKIFATAFAIFPILTKEEKPQKEQNLTKGQKIKNKLRKASPFFAFASMTPILSEELMASIRGYSWAKKLLNKNLSKKVLKTNIIAYMSYLFSALSFSAMALVGKKIKDKSQTENRKS